MVAPPSAAVAPPGHYMLFLLNDAGVPSEAGWVSIDPERRPISRRSARRRFPAPPATSTATGSPIARSASPSRMSDRRAMPAPSTSFTARPPVSSPPATRSGDQDIAGVGEAAEAGDGSASALATGDFNDDGYADLAVGGANRGPGLDDGRRRRQCPLRLRRRTLTATGVQIWNQDSGGVADCRRDHRPVRHRACRGRLQWRRRCRPGRRGARRETSARTTRRARST